MDERKQSVKERLEQKREFKNDLQSIVDDTGLARDLAQFDVESGKVNRVKMSEGLGLTRKQSSNLVKDNFEMKISKMSERIQSDLDETD